MNARFTDISVVIPCRNDAINLKALLSCLSVCDPKPLEIVIVDDGSLHPITNSIIDLDIRIIRNEESHGPAFARNAGVQIATGEIVLFLDSDVIVASDIMHGVSESFRRFPEISAVQAIYDREISDLSLPTCYQNLYYIYAFESLDPLLSAVCATFCFAVRRCVFNEMGGFDARIPFPTVEDEAFGYRLAAHKHVILFNRNIKVRHLAHYSIYQLIRRKFRMSFHQISHFLQGGNQILRQISRSGKNPTHHSFAILLCITIAPLALLSPFFHWIFGVVWLCIYCACNLGFWKFCRHDQHGMRILWIIALTWIDHLTIAFGLVIGTLKHFVKSRF